MERPQSISVCMATYNGADYVSEQIESILKQLSDEDELVIVDDCSTDSTRSLITDLNDPRIRLYAHTQNRGYVQTFEEAISLAKNEIIMLSDQDDVWSAGRARLLCEALADSDFVASNFDTFGADPNWFQRLQLSATTSRHRLRNLLLTIVGTRPYYGCTMAFRHSFLGKILPFPEFLSETHDQWLAITANVSGVVTHVENVTVHRRLHGGNTTPTRMRSIGEILSSRIMLTRALVEAVRRSTR